MLVVQRAAIRRLKFVPTINGALVGQFISLTHTKKAPARAAEGRAFLAKTQQIMISCFKCELSLVVLPTLVIYPLPSPLLVLDGSWKKYNIRTYAYVDAYVRTICTSKADDLRTRRWAAATVATEREAGSLARSKEMIYCFDQVK